MEATHALRNIGRELRYRRKSRKLSQEALAFAAGLHPNIVGRIERGKHNPRVLTLVALADALGLELRELVSGSEQER